MKALKISILLALTPSGFAATHYVDLNGINPTPPYTTWATAARVIQDAVDAAAAGDEVVTTNGIYRPMSVDKPLSLRSVNGSQFTTIDARGSGRCAFLADGASLSGFTLTNGAADSGGGAVGGTLNNCILSGNGVWPGEGGGAYRAVLNYCTLSNNGADYGGGASVSTLNHCTLIGNRAEYGGGGAYGSTLTNCTLSGNWTGYGGFSSTHGGGAYRSSLDNCLLIGNYVVLGYPNYGGGASYCALNRCTLLWNRAGDGMEGTQGYGGGASYSTLNNCILSTNVAVGTPIECCVFGGDGGGAFSCALNNCTLTGNSAVYSDGAGGAAACTLNNCITYFNVNAGQQWPNYDPWSTLNYCCTTPQPTNGVGNISNAPLFVDETDGNFRLQANSPCINAGNNDYVTAATDLDGSPRILGGTVDIGAYEFATPELLLQHLIDLVNQSSLSAKQPLLASLDAAMSSLQRSTTVSAINQLQAFQNKVRAQVEPVDAALAGDLSQLALEVAAALDAEKGAKE